MNILMLWPFLANIPINTSSPPEDGQISVSREAVIFVIRDQRKLKLAIRAQAHGRDLHVNVHNY